MPVNAIPRIPEKLSPLTLLTTATTIGQPLKKIGHLEAAARYGTSGLFTPDYLLVHLSLAELYRDHLADLFTAKQIKADDIFVHEKVFSFLLERRAQVIKGTATVIGLTIDRISNIVPFANFYLGLISLAKCDKGNAFQYFSNAGNAVCWGIKCEELGSALLEDDPKTAIRSAVNQIKLKQESTWLLFESLVNAKANLPARRPIDLNTPPVPLRADNLDSGEKNAERIELEFKRLVKAAEEAHNKGNQLLSIKLLLDALKLKEDRPTQSKLEIVLNGYYRLIDLKGPADVQIDKLDRLLEIKSDEYAALILKAEILIFRANELRQAGFSYRIWQTVDVINNAEGLTGNYQAKLKCQYFRTRCLARMDKLDEALQMLEAFPLAFSSEQDKANQYERVSLKDVFGYLLYLYRENNMNQRALRTLDRIENCPTPPMPLYIIHKNKAAFLLAADNGLENTKKAYQLSLKATKEAYDAHDPNEHNYLKRQCDILLERISMLEPKKPTPPSPPPPPPPPAPKKTAEQLEIEKLQAQIAELNKQIAQLKEQETEANNKALKAQGDLAAIKASIKQKEEEQRIKDKETEQLIALLTKKLEKATAEVTDRDSQIASLNATIEELRAEKPKTPPIKQVTFETRTEVQPLSIYHKVISVLDLILTNRFAEATRQLKALNNPVNTHSTINRKLIDVLVLLLDLAQKAPVPNNHQTNANTEFEKEKARLRLKIDQLTAAERKARDEAKSLENQIKSLNARVQSLEQTNKTLSQQLLAHQTDQNKPFVVTGDLLAKAWGILTSYQKPQIEEFSPILAETFVERKLKGPAVDLNEQIKCRMALIDDYVRQKFSLKRNIGETDVHKYIKSKVLFPEGEETLKRWGEAFIKFMETIPS